MIVSTTCNSDSSTCGSVSDFHVAARASAVVSNRSSTAFILVENSLKFKVW